ncbi:MAG: Fic family protein [Cyanobacteriota bacterium]|nr:Fic family protein [Cyanobacteriota bacterium]
MASSWIWQQPDWPRFRWDSAVVDPLVLEARAARQALLSSLEALEPPLDREAISALLGRESLGTAAIEGELLDPGQVRSSIARRLRLPLADGQPVASAQVEGLLDVLLEATSALEAPLTLATLHHWHRRLFAAGPDGLRAIRIGELRDQAPMQVLSGAIGRERLHFEAPPRAQLEQQLADFLDWIACPPAQLDGLVRAGLAHLWFLTLHPYEDGNGRLARAITDRLLAQDSRDQVQQELAGRALGISAQILREREGYTTALERCQRGDLDVTSWLSWFLEQLTAAAATNGAVVDGVQRKAAFWWSHRRSGFNSRQQKLLNRLLDAEPEEFTGGMTLRKAISLTKVSRATAWRDLAELVELQAIEPIGEGRSRAYRIRWR